MTQERDKLAQLLFPEGEGAKLVNFKLFRSAGNAVSEAHIRDEVHSALVQAWVAKTAKTRDTFPRCEGEPISVTEMVERL